MRRVAAVVVASGLWVGCHVDERFSTLHMKQPEVSDPFKVAAWRLKNGLKLAILRDPRARISSIDLRFDVGTGDDPIATPGIALLTGEALALHAAQGDIELSTAVSIDLDRTDIAVTAIDLPHALELAAGRLATTCTDFTPELLAVARDHALQQLTGVPSSFVRAVWGDGHPYGHSLGEPELASITPEQLCSFYTSHYAPANATLVVTGPTPAELPGQLEARLGGLSSAPSPTIVAQPGVTAIVPTTRPVRRVVFGLAKPTAAFAFVVPAQGDQDDLVVELATRRIRQWGEQHKLDLRIVTVGGRRGRALVIGLEVAHESELARAHDRLRDVLAEANVLEDTAVSEATADDQLIEAQALDDPFTRGAKIADLVATGRRLDLLRRVHAFAAAKSPRLWIQSHLTSAPARTLDLVPGGDVTAGVSLDNLADPGSALDRSLAGALGAAPAAPAPDTLPALARPILEYTLANGLRVLLAADPGATTIDVRLVFPVGTKDEPATGIATRAATDLVVNEGYNAGITAMERIAWYANAVEHTDVDVTETSTHFRAVGFAALGDWHLFSVAWHVIAGTYELAPLGPFHRHYVAKGAALIVSGGFDTAAVKPIIERWYGTWPLPTQLPPTAMAVPRGPKRPITYEPGEIDSVELELAYGAAGHTNGGAAQLLASALELRLAQLTRASAQITVAFDPRDSRLVVVAQMDSHAAAETAHVITSELAQFRATGASEAEVARARRRAVSQALASEVGVSGRAHELEIAVITHRAPNDDSYVAELRSATADQVTDAARELIDPATLQVTLRSPKASTSNVLRAIGFDPSTADRR